MDKTLYCIRHGQATHNVLYEELGMNAFYDKNNYDTKLTNIGYCQATELGDTWNYKHNISLVIVSPLTRTLQTAINIFKDTNCKIIALDCLKEYPQGCHTCNKRSTKNYLQDTFPRIDFSLLNSQEDEMWSPDEMETIDSLLERIHQMYNFIKNKDEKTIAMVGHNGFISMIKDGKFNYKENGDEELKHCYPYKIQLNL